jgi:hypothetical protein
MRIAWIFLKGSLLGPGIWGICYLSINRVHEECDPVVSANDSLYIANEHPLGTFRALLLYAIWYRGLAAMPERAKSAVTWRQNWAPLGKGVAQRHSPRVALVTDPWNVEAGRQLGLVLFVQSQWEWRHCDSGQRRCDCYQRGGDYSLCGCDGGLRGRR